MEDLKLVDKIFINLDEKEREDNLAATCHKVVENHAFDRKFSKEEKMDLRDQYTDINIEIEDIEEELAAVAKSYKDRIKDLKNVTKSLKSQIKTGTIPVKERVYLFQDERNMTMAIYDRNGQRVQIRPLTAEERQMAIPLHGQRTGTHS